MMHRSCSTCETRRFSHISEKGSYKSNSVGHIWGGRERECIYLRHLYHIRHYLWNRYSIKINQLVKASVKFTKEPRNMVLYLVGQFKIIRTILHSSVWDVWCKDKKLHSFLYLLSLLSGVQSSLSCSYLYMTPNEL